MNLLKIALNKGQIFINIFINFKFMYIFPLITLHKTVVNVHRTFENFLNV